MVSGLVLATTASAGEVTLKSTDETINLRGEFVSFEEGAYTIRTALGDLRISAARVRCEGADCPQIGDVEADVAIVGSDSIGLGMMPLLMTGFAASMEADAELSNTAQGQTVAKLISDGGFGDEIGSYLVSATSDSDAFAALLDGKANVGMSSRRITKDEARALRAAGAGSMVSPNQERIIAVDSMVVVTHPSNEVEELSIEQLRGVFSGEITNWSELGGKDKAINVIDRDYDTASYDFFMSYLFDGDRPDFLPQGIARDDQHVSNTVYSDPNAIGYLGYAFQRGAKPVTLINECGIATTPDAFSAKTEEYALNRRMYLYNRADNLDAQSKALLDFAISEEADAVIGKSGFIDLGVLRREQSTEEGRGAAMAEEAANYGAGYEGEVIREMLQEMDKYDRLSTTFRFRTGSSKVDERGKLDMERLIDYLKDVPEGTEVTLVGFTDDVGAFDSNRRLSLGRASEVAEGLRKVAGDQLAHIDMRTTGFGEVAPSACNVSDLGRGINRRVEVWISKDSAT
jgi:phosphate transport system substrate-binding protein